ncbi:MAG: MurR/RpiR family transcriptional regulator [Pseudonocardiaceae bacterium]
MVGTAVALLAEAERIIISGTGPTAGVARYMAVLLGRIGRPAATITGTGVSMADEALVLRRGDALVLLAYTPLHHHAAVLIDVARLRRAPVLLVTDTATDVVGVDLMLTCPRQQRGSTNAGEA